jgi:hypothetical protein
MATYLFAWNPERWAWEGLSLTAAWVKRGEVYVEPWGTANKQARPGDRAFLIKLGRAPKGVMGSGTIKSEPYTDLHWDTDKAKAGRRATYVNIEWDSLLDPERDDILEGRLLDGMGESRFRWDTRSSGVRLPDEVAQDLEVLWASFARQRSRREDDP